MKSWERDPRTHVNVIRRLVDMTDMPPEDARLVAGELERYVFQRIDEGRWLPEEITRFHTQWYREIYRVMGVADPFSKIKRRSNAWAAEVIGGLELASLRAAVVASIIANRLDYGALEHTPDELPLDADDFAGLESTAFLYDDFEELEAALRGARRILYLVDNSGEVLFDKVVIERIRGLNAGARVAVAAKASPMLNDATIGELAELGFEDLAAVVSTGSNCFGVPEDEVSAEFAAELRSADVIVAKGQAYLEFWLSYDMPNLFHLVSTKFPINDPRFGEVPKGENLILGSDRYRHGRSRYAFDGDRR